ncbi:MAG TPA: hypothetical protein VGE74_05800 [Gemmata sp.]
MTRFTDGPAAGVVLSLRRAPLFLRVVRDAAGKFDALDQLADEPAVDESLTAYVLAGEPSVMFLDWTEKGKRRGGRFVSASYRHVPDQPPDWVMRDQGAWRAWCAGAQQRQKNPTPTPKPCPTCKVPLDPRGRCWGCKEWVCGCGRFTGSCLISVCLTCQCQAEAVR